MHKSRKFSFVPICLKYENHKSIKTKLCIENLRDWRTTLKCFLYLLPLLLCSSPWICPFVFLEYRCWWVAHWFEHQLFENLYNHRLVQLINWCYIHLKYHWCKPGNRTGWEMYYNIYIINIIFVICYIKEYVLLSIYHAELLCQFLQKIQKISWQCRIPIHTWDYSHLVAFGEKIVFLSNFLFAQEGWLLLAPNKNNIFQIVHLSKV